MKRKAFTLLEVLLSFGLLSLLTFGLFSVFATGTSVFTLGVSRSGLQSEMRALMATLGRDITHSSFYTVSALQPGTIPVPLDATTSLAAHRDSLCCAVLADMNDPASYDPETGLPFFDRFAIYMATNEVPYGKLIKFQVDDPNQPERPAPRSIEQLAFNNLAGVVNAYPATAILPRTERLLTPHLFSFQVLLDSGNQNVRLNVVLRGEEGRISMGRHTTAELLESKMFFRPENTWPKL